MKRSGIQMVRHVWNHNQTTAWETLNNSLRCALQVAIASGMTFTPKDFDEIKSKYRPEYWLGEHGYERPYADAIAYGNTSFIKAFEAWSGRGAFIANNVEPGEPFPKLIHRLGIRARGRLALYYGFGDGYRVTSIQREVLIAVRECGGKRTVTRFTRVMLREMFPARKKPKVVTEPTTESEPVESAA